MRVNVVLSGLTASTPSGNLTIASVVLIDHPSGPVLVDSGAWHQRLALHANLRALAVSPDDVVAVIYTHLHWDHCMNFELFRSARSIVSKAEWERAGQPNLDHATPFFVREAMEKVARVEIAEPGEIMSGVRMLATPGHTVGHISVSIDASQRVVVAGDALPTRQSRETGLPHLIFGDEGDARRSVAAILADADIVVPGHDAPFDSRNGSHASLSLLSTSARSPL